MGCFADLSPTNRPTAGTTSRAAQLFVAFQTLCGRTEGTIFTISMGFSLEYQTLVTGRNTFFFVIAIVFGAVAAPASGAQGGGALIVLDRPSSQPPDQLSDAGAFIVRDMGLWQIAVAEAGALENLDRLGIDYTVVDDSIEGKSYYTVSPLRRVPPLRTPGIGELSKYGRILYSAGSVFLVESPAPAAELLPGVGFDIARVFLRPVKRSRPVDHSIPSRKAIHSDRSRPFGAPSQADSLIQAMVDAVSGAEIDATVQRLQDFVTRTARHDSCQAAANWIFAQFHSFGLDSVYFQNFDPLNKDNVVAIKLGETQPQQYVIIGGHYDSVSNEAYIAPGADDNASGTACVLECARIMNSYAFDKTIVFIAFGAEEQGLQGSEFYASQAAANGDDIFAMVNVDMIGYLEGGDILDLDIIKNVSSTWIRDRAMAVAAAFVPGLPVVDGNYPFGSGSDQRSFWDHGFDAISLFEDTDQSSPWLHTIADTIGLSYNSPLLAVNSTRVAVALMADLSGTREYPIAVGDALPVAFSLEQNVPNPFNPRTMIRFSVQPPGGVASLVIYDVVGRRVVSLLDNENVSGTKTAWWDGRGERGQIVPSGVYFYRLTVGRVNTTRKMILLR
jgi:hypothetical protein